VHASAAAAAVKVSAVDWKALDMSESWQRDGLASNGFVGGHGQVWLA
jgi:hypothetical protein